MIKLIYLTISLLFFSPFDLFAQGEIQDKIKTTGLSDNDKVRFNNTSSKKAVPLRKVNTDIVLLHEDSLNQVKRKEEEHDYLPNVESQ